MKIGILTGGGDCPGLNPAIRGFVMRSLEYGHSVHGILEGWRGLVEDIVEPAPLTLERVEEINAQGGTILFSSRTNPFKNPSHIAAVRETIAKHGFDAIAAIGGEDTLGVAYRIWHEVGVPTVGVPKTLDNDLPGTDYTFGFDSAIAASVEAVDRLRDTAKSHNRVMVLEVMGRHAGWVALYTGVAGGADGILIPEEPADLDSLCAHLVALRQRGKKHAVVVVSEGVEFKESTLNADAAVDAFGHKNLQERRVGESVACEIQERTGYETRATSIGYVQRGGKPSAFDRVLATRLGIRAARCVHEGDFGKMAALRGTEVVAVPLELAASGIRTVPGELIEELKTLTHG